MENDIEIIDVTADNVERQGFFCLKSRPKSNGYRRKLDWLKERFAEGMRLKILRQGARLFGFIEYIPGEYSWRAVQAENYSVIHCLWVVGQGKGKGYGTRLLNECLEDARRSGQNGVAMVTSGETWLADKGVLLKNGFEVVDRAAPAFELLALRFDSTPYPAFPTDWEARLERCGPGLTLVTSDQCPYLDAIEQEVARCAAQRGLEIHNLRLESSRDIRERAVSPYGVFNLVYNGRALTYHWEPEQKLGKLLDEAVSA